MAKEKIKSTGVCKYCGSLRIVNAAADMTQTELDAMATEDCDCEQAKHERDKEQQKNIAIANLKLLIGDKCPKATIGLTGMIPFIQDYVFTEVTVKLNEVSKVQMKMNDKGSIIITKTDTIKDTVGE